MAAVAESGRVSIMPAKIGLTKTEAAAHIGISAPTFEQLVHLGLMPAAKKIGARREWDRRQVEIAFANLPDASIDAAVLEDQEAAKWAM